MPSSQLSRGMIQVPDHTATEYTFAHPISTLHDLAAVSSREAIPNTAPTKTNLGTRGTEQLCICGNKLSCPLSLVKQRRLGTNPRVQRGFIRLAAVFRGRFVRQLLATHKVYDLIRTIKDTAKLALSIHVERKASHTLKRAESQNAEIASPQPTTDSDQLPDEELILEARLLAQLRGSLNQLHEIFFSWPLSNQIDLLRVSRSLPHRNKRATTHPEDLRHNAHVCDAACDEWPQRCATEQRRRWGSVATHGECKDSSEWTGKSNRMEMDKPPMSCGPSSLTKLIDSVRKSWPTSQLKSLSIHSKSDRFGGGATPSTLQRSQQPSARSSNMVRRPVSGPLGKARTNVTDDSQHPVRYRIISSPYPPDSSAFLSTSRRCTLQYPLYNHQSGRTTSVDARRIVSTCEEPTAGAPRRINRWGDEKFQNRNSLFEST
ncbi:unnamed protein product [Dicrocoelium dendriticum]|nr:unnamed protein product [Dicrocoelium dendriticum]